ncbi:MAG TPA: DUF2007 domain-containing protein [Dermatophilaceae bacterium]|nr:DUF2007 domain-containing protein [Dermatophilaceae bacterium]
MAELVRTNDVAVISVVEGLLEGAEIPYSVVDRDVSVITGSIGAIRARVLVPDEREGEARELLVEADLGVWLRP